MGERYVDSMAIKRQADQRWRARKKHFYGFSIKLTNVGWNLHRSCTRCFFYNTTVRAPVGGANIGQQHGESGADFKALQFRAGRATAPTAQHLSQYRRGVTKQTRHSPYRPESQGRFQERSCNKTLCRLATSHGCSLAMMLVLVLVLQESVNRLTCCRRVDADFSQQRATTPAAPASPSPPPPNRSPAEPVHSLTVASSSLSRSFFFRARIPCRSRALEA